MLEIMIVVAIIGVLAVMAIPFAMKARLTAQETAFLNSLRLLNQEMESYAMQEGRGNYPPDAPPATVPAGFEERTIRNFSWSNTTDIGGYWDWDRATNRSQKVHGCYAGVSIINVGRTSAQMQDIDRRFDDGDLTKGSFRQHSSGYIYVIEN